MEDTKQYIPKNNLKFHHAFVAATGIPNDIATSLLAFLYKNNGYIAGSSALGIYNKYKGSDVEFKAGDLDIYIPIKDMPRKELPTGTNIDSLVERELNATTIDPKIVDLKKDVPIYGKNVDDWLFILNQFKSYFCDYLGVYKLNSSVKTNYTRIETGNRLPWTRICDFVSVINERDRNGRIIPATYWRDHATGHLNLPDIQLIFLKSPINIKPYIDTNYDFGAVKVYTTLEQNNPVVSLYPNDVQFKLLNVPSNWDSITLVACFKTVVNRFFKYTQRGYIPDSYKTNAKAVYNEETKEYEGITLLKAYQIFLYRLQLYLSQKLRNVFDVIELGNIQITENQMREQVLEIRDDISKWCNESLKNNFCSKISETLIYNQTVGDVRQKTTGLSQAQKLPIQGLFLEYLRITMKTAMDFYTVAITYSQQRERARVAKGTRFAHVSPPEGDVISVITQELAADKRELSARTNFLTKSIMSKQQLKDPVHVPKEIASIISSYVPIYG